MTLLAAAAACGPPDEFFCEASVECGPGGTCQADRHCSFLDPACASGSRYGAHGGAVSGLCVGEGPGVDAMGSRPDASLPLQCENDDPASAALLDLPSPRIPLVFQTNLACASDDGLYCGGGVDLFYEIDHVGDELVWITATGGGVVPPTLGLFTGSCLDAVGLGDCSVRPCGNEVEATLAASMKTGRYCLVVEDGGGQPGLVVLQIMASGVPVAGRLDASFGVTGTTCNAGDDVLSICSPAGPDATYYLVPCLGTAIDLVACPVSNPPFAPSLLVQRVSEATPGQCDVGSSLLCPGGAELTFDAAGPEPLLVSVESSTGASNCGMFSLEEW
jgi:hypothetical protein